MIWGSVQVLRVMQREVALEEVSDVVASYWGSNGRLENGLSPKDLRGGRQQ
jgi:hypothetical protein